MTLLIPTPLSSDTDPVSVGVPFEVTLGVTDDDPGPATITYSIDKKWRLAFMRPTGPTKSYESGEIMVTDDETSIPETVQFVIADGDETPLDVRISAVVRKKETSDSQRSGVNVTLT